MFIGRLPWGEGRHRCKFDKVTHDPLGDIRQKLIYNQIFKVQVGRGAKKQGFDGALVIIGGGGAKKARIFYSNYHLEGCLTLD